MMYEKVNRLKSGNTLFSDWWDVNGSLFTGAKVFDHNLGVPWGVDNLTSFLGYLNTGCLP
jgi:hypothetical protein